MATTFDPDFETLRTSVAPLDGYYLPTRYTDSLPDSIPARIYTRVVAEEALRLTDQALRLLRTGIHLSRDMFVSSITYREGLMALPGQGQLIDLR